MSDLGGPADDDIPRGKYSPGERYALSGRIMLTAIIVLFFIVLLMVSLHLYARWYLLRSRRRRHFLRRNRHNRRTHIVFYVDPSSAPSRGLDASVLHSLPVFTCSSSDAPRDGPLECAVCLSEFEHGEKARLLPKCGHSFHIDCIDMWFQSHATCPLCRSPVELPETNPAPPPSITPSPSTLPDPSPSPASSLCSDCQCEESATASRAGPSSSRRKPQEFVGVTIEVPRRAGLDEESASESPVSQYRSPMSRMLSFRRILSRERRGNVSPSASASAELDIERGKSADSAATAAPA